MMTGDPLFRDGDLDNYLRSQVDAIDEHVRKKVQLNNLMKNNDDIVNALLPEARVGALEVDFDNPSRDVKDVQVEVADQFRGGRVRISGVCATKAFPYKGNRSLFKLRPNSFTSRLPYATITASHVILTYEGPSNEEAIKRDIGDQEVTLKFYVDASYRQVAEHDAALSEYLLKAVILRRTQLNEVAKIKDF
jgi:hypothetical protein